MCVPQHDNHSYIPYCLPTILKGCLEDLNGLKNWNVCTLNWFDHTSNHMEDNVSHIVTARFYRLSLIIMVYYLVAIFMNGQNLFCKAETESYESTYADEYFRNLFSKKSAILKAKLRSSSPKLDHVEQYRPKHKSDDVLTLSEQDILSEQFATFFSRKSESIKNSRKKNEHRQVVWYH